MKHVKPFESFVNEDTINEGLSEKVQSFVKMCQLVADKNEKDPEAVASLFINDHGFSYGKLKEMISALEKI